MEPSTSPTEPSPVGPSDPITPDPITPDPITPDPITPDPITPDPITPTPPTTPPPTTGPLTGPLTFLTAPKQSGSSAVDGEDAKPTDETQSETVDFAPEDSITLAEGQQVIVDDEEDEAVISPLSPEDFIDLLEGPLIDGFAVEIPGMANLRRSFERLFPGVPLPYFWVPSIPSPPIRFPFPF